MVILLGSSDGSSYAQITMYATGISGSGKEMPNVLRVRIVLLDGGGQCLALLEYKGCLG